MQWTENEKKILTSQPKKLTDVITKNLSKHKKCEFGIYKKWIYNNSLPSGDKNVCNVYISTRQGVLLNLRSNIIRHFPNRNRILLYAQRCVPVSYLSDSAVGQSSCRTVAEQWQSSGHSSDGVCVYTWPGWMSVRLYSHAVMEMIYLIWVLFMVQVRFRWWFLWNQSTDKLLLKRSRKEKKKKHI